MNIRLEQILPRFGIKEIICVSENESHNGFRENIKKFVPVKQLEDIMILSDSK